MAQELSEEEIQSGAVYPDLNRIREISEKVAVDVSKYLFDAELATYRPEPHDHAAWVASKVFKEKFESIFEFSFKPFQNFNFRTQKTFFRSPTNHSDLAP